MYSFDTWVTKGPFKDALWLASSAVCLKCGLKHVVYSGSIKAALTDMSELGNSCYLWQPSLPP